MTSRSQFSVNWKNGKLVGDVWLDKYMSWKVLIRAVNFCHKWAIHD